MVRDLIVCCDGTNNSPTGGKQDTNVLRLFAALRRQQKPDRLLYYDPGVGAPDELPVAGIRRSFVRKLDRLAGLASGQGIFENITEAYSFLVRHYRAGDHIWLFGFSRGAFAARSVAGIVNMFGILKPEHRVVLPTVLRVYFASTKTRKVRPAAANGKQVRSPRSRESVAGQIRELFTNEDGAGPWVHFVGVWDTVESVGMPGMSLKISGSPTIRGKCIRHARQALSLDEHRWPFKPRFYYEADFGSPTPDGTGQSLQQAWFRGVHSDVGGGYSPASSGLSAEALQWMVGEANACGLQCPLDELAAISSGDRVAHDPLYETPWWAVAGQTVRPSVRGGSVAPVSRTPTPGTPPKVRSVWDKRRPAWTFLLCLAGAAVALLMSGYMLMPGSGWNEWLAFVSTPTKWGDAIALASDLAVAQLYPWSGLHGPFDIVAASGTCPRRALVCDLAFIGCYAYVLARLCTRAFHRRAGFREVGLPAAKLSILGAALPLLVFGDALENLLGIAAFSCGEGSWTGLALFSLGVLPAAAKFVGLLGCLWLLAIGWLLPPRR